MVKTFYQPHLIPKHLTGPEVPNWSSWAKKKKSKEASASATLASVTKEMAQPRFAESARKVEEDANHEITKHTNNQGSER